MWQKKEQNLNKKWIHLRLSMVCMVFMVCQKKKMIQKNTQAHNQDFLSGHPYMRLEGLSQFVPRLLLAPLPVCVMECKE